MLRIFWEGHDPDPGHAAGQRRRHPVPVGDLLRTPEQRDAAIATRDAYQTALTDGRRPDHDRDRATPGLYYAEDYHQQYLHKVPNGYCGIGGTGVSCPVGAGVTAA